VDGPQIRAAGLLDKIDDAAREQRIDLIQQLLADGFSLEEIREATANGRLTLLPVDRVLHSQDARYTRVDLANQSGLSLEFLSRLWHALGRTDPDDDDVVFGDPDLDAVKLVATFRAAGLDEDTLCLINQVLGQGMARVSDTIVQSVGEALLQAGDNEQTLGLRYAQATEHLIPLLTPLLGYVLGVQFKDQIKSAVVTQAELATGHAENAREMTICFADLVDFTRLGERVSPEALGRAGRQLTDMAVAAARPPVRLVKMIGDAAMLVSPDPLALVEAALSLVGQAERHRETMLPLRVGIASGRSVVDSGDWFGPPVNLASRITDIARPTTVLATKDVRDALTSQFDWSYAGRRRFKGIGKNVSLYRVRPLTTSS
jgi:adenylate cyclase